PPPPLKHHPPFHWPSAAALVLPHWPVILAVLLEPVQTGTDESLLQYLSGAAFYTWREAFIGFVVGTLLGLALALVFVHSKLAERALVPYVIASQTIPI